MSKVIDFMDKSIDESLTVAEHEKQFVDKISSDQYVDYMETQGMSRELFNMCLLIIKFYQIRRWKGIDDLIEYEEDLNQRGIKSNDPEAQKAKLLQQKAKLTTITGV